jgi:hypothetical protein
MVVDVSDTTMSSSGTNKKVTITNLASAIVAAGSVTSVNGQTGVVVLDSDDIYRTGSSGDTINTDLTAIESDVTGIKARLAYTGTTTDLKVDSNNLVQIDSALAKATVTIAGVTAATIGDARSLFPALRVGASGSTYDLPASRGTTTGHVPVFDSSTNGSTWQALKVAELTGNSDDLTAGTTNLFLTSAERTKLAGITAGAAVAAVTGTAPIVSSGGTSPAISITAATTSAAGSMSAADKSKLDGIAAGAEVNVNADWNAVSGDAQILNKPTLATVATTGSYTDLIDKPTIVSSVTGTAPIVSSGGTTPAISISAATTSAAGSMSSADKSKLNGIAAGAEVNQNAFSNVAVAGQTTVAADTKTDTLTLVAGSNITLTTDASTDSITIAASGGGTASDSFTNIAVSGQTTIVADSSTDTLTFAQSGGMEITTNATTDTVTFRSRVLDEDDVTLLTARQIDLNSEYLELVDGVSIVANFSAGSSAFGEEVRVVGGTTAGGQITLFEGASGANYVGFKAPDTLAANKVWTLPSADGTSGQALTTNGSGTLSFATIPPQFFAVESSSSTAYTLASGDAGKYKRMTATTAITVTLNTGVFATGDEVLFEQNNTGQITVTAGSGVTLRNSSAFNPKSSERYAIIGLKCVASNEYILTGERELA